MKTKKIEMDFDIIGGQGSLSVAEEKALSVFFKKQKKLSDKSSHKTLKRKDKISKRQKISSNQL